MPTEPAAGTLQLGIMATYETELLAREEIAEGTMAFHFAKPAGFDFTAGQSVNLTLLDPPETDGKGNSRTFSIVSAPSEYSLTVATRMRDTAYKRALKAMRAGTRVRLRGPAGQFVLNGNDSGPVVFLAGGIGITPFVSILRAAATRLPRPLWLFYSNRRPEDSAFLTELRRHRSRNPAYRFVGTMTDMEHSHRRWNGELGPINKEMLARYIHDLLVPTYYIAGPPAMVEAMANILAGAGVKAAQVRTDEFFGY